MPEPTLTHAERLIAGDACDIDQPGANYCFTHHSPAWDAVACLDVEDLARQLLAPAWDAALSAGIKYERALWHKRSGNLAALAAAGATADDKRPVNPYTQEVTA